MTAYTPPGSTPTTALLFVNPNSRKGRSVDLGAGISRLNDAGITVERVQSSNPTHTNLVIAARHAQVNFVIIAGGDGTISGAAEALYRYCLPLAILPLGTANDLARSLAIPTNLDEAFSLIIANCRHRIDLGKVNGHYFFNACHLGLAVSITHRLTPEVKRKWGVLGYLKASISALARRRHFSVELTVDGKSYYLRALQLTVGNGRYYGGGNIVAEESRVDDGLLTLSCLYPKTLWELLVITPLIRLGKQQLAHRTFCTTGHHITVATSAPMEVAADGEPLTHTPVDFTILHRALEVFIPHDAAQGGPLLVPNTIFAEVL